MRQSLVDSSLKDYAFQLLPLAVYPASRVEQLARWQAEAVKSWKNPPRFKVFIFAGQEQQAREAISLQSYPYFDYQFINSASEAVISGQAEYCVFCSAAILLHPSALYIIAKTLLSDQDEIGSANRCQLIFANEVGLSIDGRQTAHYLRRSELEPFSLLGRNTCGEFIVVSKKLLESSRTRMAALTPPYFFWSLALHAVSQAAKSELIPLSLVARIGTSAKRISPNREFLQDYTAFAQALGINSVETSVTGEDSDGVWLKPKIPRAAGKIQVLIPFRNRSAETCQCLAKLELQDCAKDCEVVVIDNGSEESEREKVQLALHPEKFGNLVFRSSPGSFNFAKINNAAAGTSSTPYILLMNNDVELEAPDSLSELRNWCALESVGAVGATLRYNDGRIQHAGINFAAMRPTNIDAEGYYANTLRRVSAVSFALALIKRGAWNATGGLDEINCPNGFGDALFGQKLKELKLSVLHLPWVEAIHHESISREKAPEELELLELVRHGVAIADLQDDFCGSFQPMRLSFLETGPSAFEQLVERIKVSKKLRPLAEGSAKLVFGVTEKLRLRRLSRP